MAEIGVNFSSLDEARQMIAEAKKSGANTVKFQLYNEETVKDSPFKEQLLRIMLTEDNVKELSTYARLKGLQFALTPMYVDAVAVANSYADIIKIRFRDHENQELVEKAVDTGKTVLVSVDRAAIPSKDSLLSQLYAFNPRVYQLFCLPLYPPQPEDFCLESATTCKGVSLHFPHTLFDLAFAINRTYDDVYIEKHVMISPLKILDREVPLVGGENWKYIDYNPPPDHAVSVTFDQLKEFTEQLLLLERMKRVRL